jgi:hypothetical protein
VTVLLVVCIRCTMPEAIQLTNIYASNSIMIGNEACMAVARPAHFVPKKALNYRGANKMTGDALAPGETLNMMP